MQERPHFQPRSNSIPGMEFEGRRQHHIVWDGDTQNTIIKNVISIYPHGEAGFKEAITASEAIPGSSVGYLESKPDDNEAPEGIPPTPGEPYEYIIFPYLIGPTSYHEHGSDNWYIHGSEEIEMPEVVLEIEPGLLLQPLDGYPHTEEDKASERDDMRRINEYYRNKKT